MTKEEFLTIDLTDITYKDRGVGSKAANLGKLIKNNFSVPSGFVVKITAYDLFLKNNIPRSFLILPWFKNARYSPFVSPSSSFSKVRIPNSAK